MHPPHRCDSTPDEEEGQNEVDGTDPAVAVKMHSLLTDLELSRDNLLDPDKEEEKEHEDVEPEEVLGHFGPR